MRVVTTHKVILLPVARETTSGIDGKSSPEEIKKFQDWVEAKQPFYAKNTGTGAYGKWQRLVGDAWKMFGDQYLNPPTKTTGTFKKVNPFENAENESKDSTPDKNGKKSLIDKFKDLPMGGKIGVIGGIVGLGIIATVAIAAATKKDE